MTPKIKLDSIITCPDCGYKKEEIMQLIPAVNSMNLKRTAS